MRRREASGGRRRPRGAHTAFLGRRVNRPHVEIAFVLLEGRRRKQGVRQAACVAVPFVHLRGRVAIAQKEQVHLVAGRPVFEDGPHVELGRGGAVNGRVRGVHHHRPDLAKLVAGTALLDHHLHGRARRGESNAFGKRAPDQFGFIGGLPLAVCAGKPARINQAIGGAVDHLEVVLPQVGLVDPAVERPRPRAFERDGIERQGLLGSRAGMHVVEPHGTRGGRLSGGKGGGRGEGQQKSGHDLLQDNAKGEQGRRRALPPRPRLKARDEERNAEG